MQFIFEYDKENNKQVQRKILHLFYNLQFNNLIW